MKNNLLRFLFGFVLFLPAIGYCNPFSNLFKNPNDVASKVAEFHENRQFEFWKYEIWGLDFSLDGKYLAAASPTTLEVQIWDWQNKRIDRTLEKSQGAGLTAEPIRYSPDGRLLVACHSLAQGDVVIRIWNTETWAVVHDISAINSGSCEDVYFTPDGKSLIEVHQRNPIASGDNLIIYDTSTWQPVWGLRTAPFYPKALAISPDGKFVAIGGEVINPLEWPFSTPLPTFGNPPLTDQSAIVIVDLAQHTITRTIQNYAGHLAWSPDGTYVTAAGGGGVKVFDVHSGIQVADEPLKSAHMVVRYTPDGKYLLESDMDGLGNGLGVRIWDGRHRKLLQVISGNVASLAVSRDAHYFAMSIDNKISVWQLK